MCTNMINDIDNLNICIKELRQCIEEGKQAYAKCDLAYIHLQEFGDQIKEKVTELQMVTNNFLKQNQKIDTIEHTMQTLYDSIREIQEKKRKI